MSYDDISCKENRHAMTRFLASAGKTREGAGCAGAHTVRYRGLGSTSLRALWERRAGLSSPRNQAWRGREAMSGRSASEKLEIEIADEMIEAGVRAYRNVDVFLVGEDALIIRGLSPSHKWDSSRQSERVKHAQCTRIRFWLKRPSSFPILPVGPHRGRKPAVCGSTLR